MTTATESRNAGDVFVQNWVDIVGNICWAQDQGEKVLRAFVDLQHTNREEAKELAGRVAAQVRKNQEEMQRWVRSTVDMSLAAFRPATNAQIEELTRKVEELTKKVEQLSAKK